MAQSSDVGLPRQPELFIATPGNASADHALEMRAFRPPALWAQTNDVPCRRNTPPVSAPTGGAVRIVLFLLTADLS